MSIEDDIRLLEQVSTLAVLGHEALRIHTVAQMSHLGKIDACPLKKVLQLLDSCSTLKWSQFRPPAPTRRALRRIAKRRIDKAARGNGRPFRVTLAF
jgi:hypothetical protein